ncbi:type VII secretion target [Mycobacterium xenopi]|uniref:type VII secretion target n=1 Tax=Mycobacterium xenopi TaxID=1789 RepID=UPI000D95FD80|nr:type VII secretion target [Mycobacterium xenopi]SPX94876.1 Protein of uncharacterised function (DUF2580) [Mycobacterium xenopi]
MELNVNPADLLRTADAYTELAARTAQLSPQAATEIQRLADTHGPIGYPAVIGIAAGLARAEEPLNAKIADFQTYSQRFTEHAATYTTQDHQAAQHYGTPFDNTTAVSIHVGPLPEGRVICTETPWVSRRLGLLDSDQGLVGPVCIVERSFELGRWDVAEVAV